MFWLGLNFMKQLLDAINLIADGVNPFTGELFDKVALTENLELSLAITRLAIRTQPHLKIDKKLWSWPASNPCAYDIFNLLKEWRLEQARIVGLPAYMVFSDMELRNISEATIMQKEDLLLVKGIASAKYEVYGDELYELIANFEQELK